MPLQVLEACSGDTFDYELTDEDLDNDFGEELGRQRPDYLLKSVGLNQGSARRCMLRYVSIFGLITVLPR
jgi:hypothetical protein